MQNAIEASSLTKYYDDFLAVDHIILTAEWLFKAKVVSLMLSKDTEAALELLSQHYRVAKPRLQNLL